MECAWTRKICKELERCNADVFAIVGGERQKNGYPDRIITHAWTGTVWLEFKDVNTKLQKLQAKRIQEINARNGHAYVIRAPNRVENHLGTCLYEFDETGLDLLFALSELVNNNDI